MVIIMRYLKNYLFLNKAEIKNFNDFNNIVICMDKNVTKGGGVMVYSLLSNMKAKGIVHIFYNGTLSEDEKSRFDKLSIEFNTPIIFYFIDNSYVENLFATKDINTTSYYRFLCPYILKDIGNIKKMLYLDVDMLCIGDISSIFSYDLQNKIAYVVNDFELPKDKKAKEDRLQGLNLINSQYFNSGMMFIDVDRYVREDIGEKALKLAKSKNFPHMDQDVLNILLDGKTLFTSSVEYNCRIYVSDECFNKEREIVKIIHFTSRNKPWKAYTKFWDENSKVKNKRNTWIYQYYRLWREYALKSPWKDVEYVMPQNHTEWRLAAKEYFRNGNYKYSIQMYFKYLYSKFVQK
ncbi:MAG: hypothetical protein DBY32_11010 [Phascolarctobacterium sp.]|nr:MAG: hypothetical protein DBY32_11010 [Phascolarctobacterium sp.]